ncbi:Phage Tail Collar Domain [Methylomagnum ishizawai]|uniref:Phage Tail Collar Domain n=1 Tax=Methylomagnum ishizawai TaxID=1760988 RepID=A0A1Y6D0G3_9GAMM|nr:phage tail protein [Methylomagnum ishizawai]SMF93894.1 Phage Tail Collar Domain [Methylomagnum ishizawai]
MTNFTGTASFDPVRRIEISDRVLGGDPVSSPINGTLQSLVNRDTYLQSVAASAAGLAIRYARVAVTGNVSALSGLSARDGVTPNAGDIVLLTAQTTAAQNGLWVAASGAWTRFANANGDTGLPPGCLVSVSEGTLGGGTVWGLMTVAPIVVGTTGLAFRLVVANDVGKIDLFAMGTPPLGWLECDGTAISRTTYARLFARVGTTFGEGDGSTTFGVPDLRGEFVRGWDHGRGVDTGRAFGSSQLGSPIAGEDNTANNSVFGGTINGNTPTLYDAVLSGYSSFNTKYLESGIPEIGNAGSFGIARPRNVAFMYCIRY